MTDNHAIYDRYLCLIMIIMPYCERGLCLIMRHNHALFW